jgi:hypothetical protein
MFLRHKPISDNKTLAVASNQYQLLVSAKNNSGYLGHIQNYRGTIATITVGIPDSSL